MFERIKELCKEKGITVAQLEENLGWSRSIYKWDTNTPSVTKVKAVADYFGVTVDYLLSDEEGFNDGLTPSTMSKDELLQKAFDDKPDMRILFKVAEKCSPNEIKTAIRLIEALRGETHYEDN